MGYSEQEIKQLKKDMSFVEPLLDEEFEWRTTWGLFSPKSIDEGTRLLLKYLEINETDHCLDMGCGYGPIGLFMARKAKNGHAIMVDKDFVAVEYANKNAQLNQVSNAEAFLSNGFDQVFEKRKQGFDKIATNLPAKSNREQYQIYFYDAWKLLNPGGQIYVVCINGLRKFVARSLNEVFGNAKKMKQGRVYTVLSAVKE